MATSRTAKPISSQGTSERGICVASFDSGGPGSISQLVMIKEFFERMAYDQGVNVEELIPADHFDLMGGVGFGGFCALLLGRLRMTPDRAMKELVTVADALFPNTPNELATPEANSVKLKDAVEDMLRRNDFPVGIRLNDKAHQSSRCKVVIFVAMADTMGNCHSFRTYRPRRGGVLDCTFVEAACAALAAPGLFSPITIGPPRMQQLFAVAPPGLGNPTRGVLEEARLLFGDDKPISLIPSLGAGKLAPISLNLSAPMLGDQTILMTRVVQDCERVATELSQHLCGVGAYLRLNVDQGMEGSKLSEWSRLGVIISHTNAYLQTPSISNEVDASLLSMQQQTCAVTLGQLNRASHVAVSKICAQQPANELELQIKDMRYIVQQGVENITIIDAIGNSVPIPLRYCRTYEMLDDMVKFYFKHQHAPGSDFVKRGRYKLLCGPDRNSVKPTEWKHEVTAGKTVEMSMVVYDSQVVAVICPRCKGEFEGKGRNGWAKCRSCNDIFQLTAIVTDIHRRDQEDDMQLNSSRDRRKGQGSQEQESEEEQELKRFRLISVINIVEASSDPTSGTTTASSRIIR